MTPGNEMELIVLFAQQAQVTGFEIVSIQANFPDAIIRHGEEEYRVEFEFKASNFLAHRHDPEGCDLIICWVNDEEFPPLPTLELSNPEWFNVSISSLPRREHLLGYWKKRALIVEDKLQRAEKIMPKMNWAMIELLYITPDTVNVDKQAYILSEAMEWVTPITEQEKRTRAKLMARLQKPRKAANL